uniref:apocytochrome b n=1 Tax=Porphyridium aerugineum TaxID=2792 RepID=UPI001FCD77C1|nr:apocytochrome b [Porphyridium aerugineum]UNJ18829.1 apocytochrome b [Porphyridium aerugineum]
MIWLKKPIALVFQRHLVFYDSPTNLSYAWNFGFIAFCLLALQIISGVFLAMHYTPHTDLAFNSVENIRRNLNTGWFLRYLHANGASFYFIALYVHIFRGLYFGSYLKPKHIVWILGVIILFLSIITAFLGYILPWGQMSLWGATVITSLASAIPIIGTQLTFWLWGGFSVDLATLNRFFSLHYLLPFVITALTFLHLAFLHKDGSNNPMGISSKLDKVHRYPYFILKDIVGLLIFLLCYFSIVFYTPNLLGHSDNFICANALITPAHIVPEWYFLPFYAILRSIPHKLIGVVARRLSIIILALLPWLHSNLIRSSRFFSLFKFIYWTLIFCCFILGWIGSQPVEYPYILLGQCASIYYFMFFLRILPLMKQING